MDDNEEAKLSPETEKEMRDAVNKGFDSEISNVTRLVRHYYLSFRRQGFGHVSATLYTTLVFHRMLG